MKTLKRIFLAFFYQKNVHSSKMNPTLSTKSNFFFKNTSDLYKQKYVYMKNLKFPLLFLFATIIQAFNVNAQTLVVDQVNGPYNTIGDAVAAATSGDVIIEVVEGTYPEQILLQNLQTSSITIIPDENNTQEVIVGGADLATVDNNYILKISNSDSITIDGIQFVNSNTTYGCVLSFEGNNPNFNINGCDFIGADVTGGMDTERAVIYANSTCSFDYGNFLNCSFQKGTYGVYFEKPTLTPNQMDFTDCEFLDFEYAGFYANDISNLHIEYSDFIGKDNAPNQIGVFLDSISSEIVVNSDYFRLTGSASNNGVFFNDFTEAGVGYVVNNMISITGDGDNHAVQSQEATLKMYFNNILIGGGNNISSALKINKTLSDANFQLIYNNIFSVDFQGYIFDIDVVAAADLDMDYNVYNLTNVNNFGNYNNSDIPSLISWSSTYFQDGNSFEGDPNFVGSDDLHVNNVDLIQGMGINIGEPFGITNLDFDADQRKNPPDIGADEIGSLIPPEVSQDTIWEGIVYVDTSVFINPDVTVTIMPNTQIGFLNGDTITCQGAIVANGIEEEPITFYSLTEFAWGGINISSTSDTSYFEFCNFYNSANSMGGALYFNNCDTTSILNCSFVGDSASYGGAIYAMNTKLNIDACEFIENYSEYNGGAVYINSGNVTITNSVFAKNRADGNAGGDVFLNESGNTGLLSQNTFFKSSAGNGESIYNSMFDVTIHNCIVSGLLEDNTIVNSTGNLEIKNSVVEGGAGSVDNSTNVVSLFDYYPEFVDTANYDFRLKNISPVIDSGDFIVYTPFDADGNPRVFGNFPDPGAYELQDYPLVADAGMDYEICDDSWSLYANDPHNYIGTWTIISGAGDIMEEHDYSTTIANLAQGANTIRWSVTDGVDTVYDDVIITNNSVFADAGEDVNLISDYPTLITEYQLNAVDPTPGTGEWTLMSGEGTISNTSDPMATISGLVRGETVLRWTVDANGCTGYDDVKISVGYNFYPDQGKNGLDWSNPACWNVATDVPNVGDSVTIYGTDVIISGDAHCSNLVVSSDGDLVLSGNAKGPSSLTTNRIYLEQNAEKFPNMTDTARLIVNNGTINIEPSSGGLDDGIVVGSMSELLVEPVATGVAEINVGAGRTVVVQDTAVSSKTAGNAVINIRNGGRIYLEQNAEKTSNPKSYGNDVRVGSGGRIYLEQNAEKNANSSELYVSSGRRIYLEQNAEKAIGGQIYINGGRIYLEQNAEKSSKGSYSELYVGRGSRIYLEQNAEKVADSSVITAPRITVSGGQIIVGSDAKNRAYAGKINANRIYLEQNAEKGYLSDSALIVNSNGIINIASTWDIEGEIFQESNTAITILPNGQINMLDSGVVIMEKGASFIDNNSGSSIAGGIIQNFPEEGVEMFSSPFSDLNVEQFSNSFNTFAWEETSSMFSSVNSSEIMNAGQGYEIENNGDAVVNSLFGEFNTGNIVTPMSVVDLGVNLVGNPYPSSVDWDLLNLDSEIQTTFYIYDFELNNYRTYQTNGLNFYTDSPIIPSGQAFFVVANAMSDLTFTNEARKHFNPEQTSAKSVENSFVLDVSNGSNSDKFGFIINSNSSDNYIQTEDALELPPVEEDFVSFSSSSSDMNSLSIDSRPMPSSTTVIPMVFVANEAGNYTITLEDNMLSGDAELFLYDQLPTPHSFQTSASYSFDYQTPGEPREFGLSFSGNVDIESLDDEVLVNIYSNSDKIYVVANNQIIDKIELYNVTGEKILNQTVNSSQAIIQTSLPQGVYIVKAIVDGEIYTSKIVL